MNMRKRNLPRVHKQKGQEICGYAPEVWMNINEVLPQILELWGQNMMVRSMKKWP